MFEDADSELVFSKDGDGRGIFSMLTESRRREDAAELGGSGRVGVFVAARFDALVRFEGNDQASAGLAGNFYEFHNAGFPRFTGRLC